MSRRHDDAIELGSLIICLIAFSWLIIPAFLAVALANGIAWAVGSIALKVMRLFK